MTKTRLSELVEGFNEGRWDPSNVGTIQAPVVFRGAELESNYEGHALAVLKQLHKDIRSEWLIFGAKWNHCSRCDVEFGKPCENLTRRKSGVREYVKNPHEVRIDYTAIFDRFVSLGFIVKES